MSIIGQVALSLQTALGAALDAIGRRTGVIQRQRKFSGSTLFKTLVLTVLKSPNPKTDDIVATAAQLGVTVTSEAVEKRFTPRLITFLRAGLEHLLEHTVAADPVAIPLLERFTAVEIGDSTTVTVPDDYADEFPGCGGKADSGQAAVKIQVRWELRTGKLTKLLVEPGRHSDAASEAAEDPVTPGSLVIRDLGYFQPRAVPGVGRGRGVLDLALATGHGGLRPGGTTAGVAGVRAAALGEWTPRQADFAGVGGAPVLSADRPAGAPGGGRPAAAKGVREGPKTWPRAQPGTPGLVRLDAPGDQLPGGLVDLEGGRRPVPRPLADRTPVQALEVAQPPGRVPRDVVGGGADGTVLGEADRGGPSTLAAPDVDLVQPPPQPLGKAAGVIRQWIVSLTAALDDLGALIEVLASLTRTIHAVAHKKRQRKSPSSFQLLLNPDLLNWNC